MDIALGIFHNDYSYSPSAIAEMGYLLDVYLRIGGLPSSEKEGVPPKIWSLGVSPMLSYSQLWQFVKITL